MTLPPAAASPIVLDMANPPGHTRSGPTPFPPFAASEDPADTSSSSVGKAERAMTSPVARTLSLSVVLRSSL
eukprot:jgi/Pico_ML_1/54462/g4806.t1